ncbi:hypothetical protein MLD38_031566 [Melastoma candidum]|uniref:Uncharacterized protein n=1 Tax=Melastoma candidum TaxID=119954 RepID=A0ACB9MPJ0_9MYRT|nr:hypothetical protein MLD38_031566 [Melastoma candidum]
MAESLRAIYLHYLLFLLAVCSSVSLAQPSPRQRRLHREPPYSKFVVNATELSSEDYYDYIIVGGGTAGCPLAATLSQSSRVLVLERGGTGFRNPNLRTQEGFVNTLVDVDTYDSPAQAFISEDGVPNARGRVLGGSSAINAGFYTRADASFFKNSRVHWDLLVVNRSYEWVEKAVVFRPELRGWQSTVRDGLLEAGINPYNGYNLDHVVGTKIGGSTFDRSGSRHSAADLLNFARASNIKVAVQASVERILVSSTVGRSGLSAIGVVYRDQNSRYHHAMVQEGGEVILSAGAIGSPQLLLLSGIGPLRYLSYWGIPAVYHQPYVGQFLYDNPRNGISIVPPIPLDHSLIQVVGITDAGNYIEAASNVIPFTPPIRSVFIRSPASPIYLTVATLMEKISGPQSSGSLRLASTDARINPIVRFNYFSSSVDLERCINGTRLVAAILNTRSMNYLKFREWFGGREFRYVGAPLPADLGNDLAVADFCRRTVSTIWHYHGGSVVGRVVDREFRVFGINGLRVIDGSTFGESPGTNPQATLMMLGRYMGLKMRRERMRLRPQ